MSFRRRELTSLIPYITSVTRLHQLTLLDKKWFKLLRFARPLRHLPCVDLIFITGSMAVGNVQPDSDFDLLIRVHPGRIFTVRFITNVLFGWLGFRRLRHHTRAEQADKFCFSHFFTKTITDPGLPFDEERRILYQHIVPILGTKQDIRDFYSGMLAVRSLRQFSSDQRHLYKQSSYISKLFTRLLRGSFGDWLEKILKNWQIKRIRHHIKNIKVSPRGVIRFTDREIKFHY